MKQGEIYDTMEEIYMQNKIEAIEDFYFMLKNQITIDALAKAKEDVSVLAILKRQYQQMRESIEHD